MHIISKIHVWKKKYNTLTLLLSKSGIRWNTTSNMLDIEKENHFEDVCKVDSNARLLRFKSHPFYPDWIEIFGKGCATGKHVEGIEEAASDIANNQAEQAYNATNVGPSGTKNKTENGLNNGAFFEGADKASSNNPNGKPSQRKRKSSDDDSHLVNMMKDIIQTSNAPLVDLMKCIGTEPVSDDDQDKVFDELKGMSGLTTSDIIQIAKHICKSKNDVRFFLRMSDEMKVNYVVMVLEGKI